MLNEFLQLILNLFHILYSNLAISKSINIRIFGISPYLFYLQTINAGYFTIITRTTSLINIFNFFIYLRAGSKKVYICRIYWWYVSYSFILNVVVVNRLKISLYLLLYKLLSESDPDVDISISFNKDIWTEDGELDEQLRPRDSRRSDKTALFVLNSHISLWLPSIYIIR